MTAILNEAERIGGVNAGASATSSWRLLARRFRHHRPGMVGLGILLVIVAMAVFAPLLAPYPPDQQSGLINTPPSSEHWLGTDDVGRDLLSRVIYGARNSLVASAGIVALAVGVALPVALLAGYRGGRTDTVIMRMTDAAFAFPPLVVALAIISLRGTSMVNLILAVGLVFIPSLIRLIRGQVLAVREETYIEAIVSVGAPTRRILTRHVLPNVISPLIVQISLMMGFAILAEASLSFLGLGVQSPESSWGSMLGRAFREIYREPVLVVFPGLAITLAVLAFNLFGDGLRDSLGREARKA